MNCEFCLFYSHGRCRRYPPVPIADVSSSTTGSSGDYREAVETSISSAWPVVLPLDWCGEFKKT